MRIVLKFRPRQVSALKAKAAFFRGLMPLSCLMPLFCMLLYSQCMSEEEEGIKNEEEGIKNEEESIKNYAELNEIREDLGGHYKLGADIDAIESCGSDLTNYPESCSGEGFLPIGSIRDPFTGSLDGNGYKIRNLYINRPNSDGVALFAYIGQQARIHDMSLEDVVVTGHNHVSGLVGYNTLGTISSSSITGTIRGMADYTGGLVGSNLGTISASRAEVTMIGEGSYVGGLVGQNNSAFASVAGSSATGSIMSTGNFVGGLMGDNHAGTISESQAVVNIMALQSNYVGGLVGGSGIFSSISDSHSTQDVAGEGSGIGGLVGLNSGAISGSYATGNVSASGTTSVNVGGLVGQNMYHGDISQSYASGNVTASGADSANIGGLVGGNNGFVSQNYAAGSVSGSGTNSRNIGGFVGENSDLGGIARSYALGSVCGGTLSDDSCTPAASTSNVGGLVGKNSSRAVTLENILDEVPMRQLNSGIANSYSRGNVMGGNNVGGLVGDNSDGTIAKSYAIGNVAGSNNIGGIAGKNGNTDITDSFAAGDVTGMSGTTNIGGLVGDNGGNDRGVNYANYYVDRDDSTLTELDGIGNGSCGDMCIQAEGADNEARRMWLRDSLDEQAFLDWRERDWDGLDTADIYPCFRDVPMPAGAPDCPENPPRFSDGSSTRDDPFLILTYADLNKMRSGINGHYRLGNDIDAIPSCNLDPNAPSAAFPDDCRGGGFKPIVDFRGTLNGDGYKISNLHIDRTRVRRPSTLSVEFVGLIAQALSGEIRNLGLKDVHIRGGEIVGALVGNGNIRIVNCYVSGGTVFGMKSAVGGLAGRGGSISHSFTAVEVRGNIGPDARGDAGVGGLVGQHQGGGIDNCYATGNVMGDKNIGGLVGSSFGSISNCYATGDVTGTDNFGGLIGLNGNRISNSYAAGRVSSTPDPNTHRGGLIGFNERNPNFGTNGNTTGVNYYTAFANPSAGAPPPSCSSGTTCKRVSETMLDGYTNADGQLGSSWNSAVWDFRSASEHPALKYDCDFLPEGAACGDLLPGQ